MPLADAVQSGDVLAIRECLSRGDDPNQTLDDRTLLTWAAEFAGIPVARALLAGGAGAGQRDPAGADPLDRAAAAQRRNILWLLAPHVPPERFAEADRSLLYAPVEAPRPDRDDVQMHPFFKWSAQEEQLARAAPEETALVRAAEQADADIVRQLLRTGVNPNAVGQSMCGASTPLWAAVNNGKPDAIAALAEAGAYLDDPLPEAPIFSAIEHQGAEMVRALLNAGVDPRLTTSRNETPLQYAITHRKTEVFNELLRLGADPNQLSAPHHAAGRKRHTPLQIAAEFGPQEMFDALLAAGAEDANVNALRLTLAAQTGNVDQVKQLLARGVGVNARDSLGRTPLICAASAGHTAIAKLLLKHGADANLTQGVKHTKIAPLHASLAYNKLPLVKLLVEAGANLEWRDAEGMTALDWARAERRKKTVDYLTETLVARGGAVSAIGTKLRGVPTFDVNDSCLLVEAPIEETAAQFKKHIGAAVWKKDILGKTVTLAERSYAVIRLVGVPWTGIGRLCAPIDQYPKAADAQALSAALAARAIHLANSDTAGVCQYALYDRGKLVEFFGYSGLLGKKADRAHIERHFGVPLADIDDVDIKGDLAFASKLRQVKLAGIKNDLEFVNDFIVSQNALALMFPEACGEPGEKFELEFEDFGEGEVERLDFLAARQK